MTSNRTSRPTTGFWFASRTVAVTVWSSPTTLVSEGGASVIDSASANHVLVTGDAVCGCRGLVRRWTITPGYTFPVAVLPAEDAHQRPINLNERKGTSRRTQRHRRNRSRDASLLSRLQKRCILEHPPRSCP